VLVYTNDRIPPPAKTRPHEEYGSEAHVLLQSLVLGCGNSTWTSASAKWTGESAPTSAVNNVPGLQYDRVPTTPLVCDDPGADCASAVCLDYARIVKLEAAAPASEPPYDGTYDYEDLRQILRLDQAERHFRIVIVDLNASEEVLLDYGEPIPGRTATQPATSYVELQHAAGSRDRHIVRVSVHVFHS
jgi:hypothetical protein